MSGTFFAACGDRTPVARRFAGRRRRGGCIPTVCAAVPVTPSTDALMLSGRVDSDRRDQGPGTCAAAMAEGLGSDRDPDPELTQSIKRDEPIDVHGVRQRRQPFTQ